MKGWKTISWSLFLIVAGIAATVLVSVTPDMINYFLPAKYQTFTPLIISLIGAITAVLRFVTTTPIGDNGGKPQ